MFSLMSMVRGRLRFSFLSSALSLMKEGEQVEDMEKVGGVSHGLLLTVHDQR
jgi:hypothetical protein